MLIKYVSACTYFEVGNALDLFLLRYRESIFVLVIFEGLKNMDNWNERFF